ncbi:TPA: hypothetical protein EYN98_26445 [Candidatus Poribacteria bacterium]|nr:hypothetical protein [Candidatus Poribacteria bacterium]HIB91748.1 hypothetical protein [Candidatus Poribacteria bacterium]HIN28403.1 hypothetical protein [Candidatus Poribacteria bacterium]HIO09516.1 hypothetical protein [Candidatus Poribacteria bacterium]HIO49857.1 hypothetical protein [Candidatus Poribacteria bacterium]
MARVKSRLTGEAADFDAPETKEDIIKAIKDSEVNRDVEIDYELTEEIENFPDYMDEVPAKLGFIHSKIVCINIPPVGEFTEPIPDGALSNQELYVSVRVGGVEEAEVVEESYFDPELGHVLQFANYTMDLKERKFARIASRISMSVSASEGEGRRKKVILKETPVQSVEISGSGVLVQAKRGSGIHEGMAVFLTVTNPKFPKFSEEDEYRGKTTLPSRVVRIIKDPAQPDNDNIAIAWIFENPFEEAKVTDKVSSFCMQQKLVEHQQTVEQELSDKYGGGFKKKVKRF